MGISYDLEAESMDSETKPTCNKEFVKLNGQSVCNDLDVTEAKTALTISTPSDGVSANQKKSNTDTVINLVSPTPQETETIVIVDDAEPEEGEIINTDSDFEYEAISSDEEFTLRQQIEALEAKNRELEKIASISSRTIDYDYTDGYHRPQPYSNYKTPLLANRANITKSNPPNYKSLSLSHVENISSDEAQLVDSENEFPNVFDTSKSYGRSHRKQKDKRQNRNRKARTVDNEKERCLAHGKRRCTDIDCISLEISRKKRVRHKYDDRKLIRGKYLSDSEDELVRNREELKMALNIIEPANRTVNSSSLLQKLSAIQNQMPSDDSKKSSTNKHRKRKNSRSPEHELSRRRRTTRITDENIPKHSKSEQDRLLKSKLTSPIVNEVNNENDIHEDEDEAISLEEQELRLIALKSAVLKKHEARKKKQLATIQVEQVIRPYSPTDSVVLVPDETGDRSNDCIDSDNNNMDISPISSPISNQYQPMDMDLASSNENSKSPVFSYEKPQTFPSFEQFIDWGTVHIPVPINAGYVEIDPTTATMNQPAFALQPPYSLAYDASMQKDVTTDQDVTLIVPTTIHTNLKENEQNEDELRAQLIEQMRSTNNMSLNNATEISQMRSTDVSMEKVVPKEIPINVDSLEEDCLRSLLLSSKGKKSTNIAKDVVIELPVSIVTDKPKTKSASLLSSSQPVNDNAHCDDIPKLTLNLREALKRLKNNQQNKIASNQKLVAEPKMHVDTNESKPQQAESLENCDFMEIRKTVVNNCVDNNENELCNAEHHQINATIPPSPKGSDEMMIDDSTSNDSTKKEPTQIIHVKIAAIDEMKTSQLESKSSVAPKLDTANVLKRPNVETVNSPVARKVIIKPAAIKQSPKVAVKQPPTKSNAVNKLKQNVSLPVEPEPVVIPARPKSSTPPITTKINVASMVNSTTNISKLELLRKSTASPVVAWTPKPVKKLIISLNADSSSDTDDLEQSSTTNKSNSDTPSTEPISNTFQLRLDQFLQKVRANTTHTIIDVNQPVTQTTTTISTDATTKKIVSKTTTQQKSTINSTQKAQISSKTESSKAVRYLPMSSQLEYDRLLNRMKMLEKQKGEKKTRLSKQEQTLPKATTLQSDANFPNLTVVVKNENRIIQPTGKKLDGLSEKTTTESSQSAKTLNVNKLPTNKTPLSTSNTSLAKRVLVKNAMDSLSVPKSMSELTQPPESIAKVATVKTSITVQSAPVQANEQTINSAVTNQVAINTSSADSKPTSMSLAAFAKKTPKVRASVLANYVKRFRSHGEQYLNGLAKLHRLTSRTNVETKKQQKLEQVLAELNRQARIVEGQLTQQKTLTKSLYPAMAATEKTVTSDRILMHKLENCCNRLGNIVKGSDYKIQCDKAVEIKEKIRQINIEKNKLRLLKQEVAVAPAATTPKIVAIRTPQPTKKESDLSPNNAQSIPITITSKCTEEKKMEAIVQTTEKQTDPPIAVTKSTSEEDKLLTKTEAAIVNPDPNAIQSTQKKAETALDQCENNKKCPNDSSTEVIKSEIENGATEASGNTEKTEIEVQVPMTDGNGPTNIEESQSIPATDFGELNQPNLPDKIDEKPHSPENLTELAAPIINVIESETLCGKYDSPLVHLQNCVDSKPSLSAADRNAIVCPYDLMGRCEDKQCEYKHLSM